MDARRISKAALSRFDRVAFGILALLSGVIFLYLFAFSFFSTSVFDPADPLSEHVLYQADSVLFHLLPLAALLLLCRLAVRYESSLSVKWFVALSLAVSFVLGCAWVLFIRAVPINDAGILYYTAAELAKGNVSELWRHELYLRVNPFQAGYLQYSELLQRVLGRHSYLPQGIINAAFLTGSYGALLALTWESLHDRRVEMTAALLLVCFSQPLLYATFLYGIFPGLCCALWALFCVLRWIRGGKAGWLALACALLAGAGVFKINYLIFAVALALVLIFYALGTRRFGALLAAVLLVLSPLAASQAAQRVLERRTGFALGDGAPQTTWLAMGMQEGPRAPGWYNLYSLESMEAAGCNSAQALALNKKDIADRLAAFAADPAYALSFYHQKLVSQWAETTFEAQLVNQAMTNESASPKAVDSVLESGVLREYMEGYALLIYLCFAVAMGFLGAALWRRGGSWQRLFAPLVLLVCIFGGFLYHMLFEAKSQYVLVYVIMMAPFAAWVLARPLPIKRRRQGGD